MHVCPSQPAAGAAVNKVYSEFGKQLLRFQDSHLCRQDLVLDAQNHKYGRRVNRQRKRDFKTTNTLDSLVLTDWCKNQ